MRWRLLSDSLAGSVAHFPGWEAVFRQPCSLGQRYSVTLDVSRQASFMNAGVPGRIDADALKKPCKILGDRCWVPEIWLIGRAVSHI